MMPEQDNGLAIFGLPVRGRACGGCKVCCTAMSVSGPPLNKPAGVRCHLLNSRGCSIYERRPRQCVYWSCRWLFDEAAGALRRPDQSGYVISPDLSPVLLNGRTFDTLQVWIDPTRADVIRDPALRAYIDQMGRTHALAATVRPWGAQPGDQATLLVPPSITGTGEWFEESGPMLTHEAMAVKLTETKDPSDVAH